MPSRLRGSLPDEFRPEFDGHPEENIMNLFERLLVASGLAAVTALACPAAAEELKLPEGKVAIHYFRPDGSYDGWGLHVWESFQKKDEAGDEFAAKENSDRPLKGVTWFKPVAQSGKDDFGAYWLLDTKELDNGRVNYIIHNGGREELPAPGVALLRLPQPAGRVGPSGPAAAAHKNQPMARKVRRCGRQWPRPPCPLLLSRQGEEPGDRR